MSICMRTLEHCWIPQVIRPFSLLTVKALTREKEFLEQRKLADSPSESRFCMTGFAMVENASLHGPKASRRVGDSSQLNNYTLEYCTRSLML